MGTTVRDWLRQAAAAHGPDVFNDMQKLKALLHDYAEGEQKNKIALLLALLSDTSETDSINFFSWESAHSEVMRSIKMHPAMVLIKGGIFIMGDNNYNPEMRQPASVEHTVRLDSFYLGNCPVTRAEYARYAEPDNTSKNDIVGSTWIGYKMTLEKSADTSLPVVNVNWYEAVLYCNARSEDEGLRPAYIIEKNKIDKKNYCTEDHFKFTVTWDREANGYRLPTEAEWEYACRAGAKNAYPTASNSHFARMASTVFSPVGRFPPNKWGLYDMHGRVLQWCWDWYRDYEEKKTAAVNPAGPEYGSARILRGGGCSGSFLGGDINYLLENQDFNMEIFCSARRSTDRPHAVSTNNGFRLARSCIK